MWHKGSDAEKAKASATITTQLGLFADGLKLEYLFGDKPSVADFYPFVMLLWAARFQVPVPAPLEALRARIAARPAVRIAMDREDLVYEVGPRVSYQTQHISPELEHEEGV